MASISDDPYPWQKPAKPITRGAFILIEGLDRAGKTTQVKRLCDKLYASGHNVKTVRFPGTFTSNSTTLLPFFPINLEECFTENIQTEHHQSAK